MTTAAAFASYSFQGRSIIVDIESTAPNVFRSFRLDRGAFESRDAVEARAYIEADLWANSHGLRLECFRAG
jgi:hypothetical protein